MEKIAPPAKSVGGVLLPESAVQRINSATVVAVGPGRRNADGEQWMCAGSAPGDDCTLRAGLVIQYQ